MLPASPLKLAHRPRTSWRLPLLAVLWLLAVVTAMTALPPAAADPVVPTGSTPAATDSDTPSDDPGQLERQLSELARQAEQVTEQFNAAAAAADAATQAATIADLAAAHAETRWDDARRAEASTLFERYKSASTTKAGALLTSDSAQSYLDGAADLQIISRHQDAELSVLTTARVHARQTRQAADTALASARSARDTLARQQADLTTRQQAYRSRLADLTTAQRGAFLGQGSVVGPTPEVHAPTAAAQTAVDFALAQLGKPYVYATSGPSTYDCSGLVAAAYGAAGIALPHVADQQYQQGVHVNRDQLQPGDLVFFYQPITHVGIYLGDDRIVHAPTEGDVVKISTIFDGYAGATRMA